MPTSALHLLLMILLFLISFPFQSNQQDDNDGDYTPCSFISGEGCMNGVCKFCAMCIPTYCILATTDYTGHNQGGSICVLTDQQDYGYDYYDYCLLSTENEDSCSTSTECYPYRQNNSSMQHSWTNLTCDQSICQLIMNDGSPPPIPIPLEIHPSDNVSTYNKYNIKSKSPASIALTTVCTIVAVSLFILLARIIYYKPKLLSNLFSYCCYRVPKTPISRPPSYQVVRQPMIEILPSYDQQEPSPPKYEHALVTQIRGQHHPSYYNTNDTATSSSLSAAPIWIPVYVNHDQPTNRMTVSSPLFQTFLTCNDWATVRHSHHSPSASLTIQEVSNENEDAEERRRR